MLSPAEEAEVLRLAVAQGHLRAECLSARSSGAREDAPVPAAAALGPRIDRLIAQGHLQRATAVALAQTVQRAAQDQTAPPSAPDAVPTEGPLPTPVYVVASAGPDPAIAPTPAAEPPAAIEEASSPWLADSISQATSDLGAASTPAPAVSASGSNPYLFPVHSWERYEFIKLLGRGGMGAVYKARDRRLGRIVALKFLHVSDDRMVRRFMQEARAQSRIDHDSICKVYEVGEVDGKVYIAMQYIDGQPLHAAIGTLSLQDKARVIKEAAEALHAAHELGIIHRDIKPANIMLQRTPDAGPRPVIMDFGLARESGEGQGLTESGAVMGTPAYMAPEQARGDTRLMDRRTDVYGLGATLYALLAGAPPFVDETPAATMLRVITEEPKLLRSINHSVSPALEIIVSKCLNKEQAQRYATARDLADDLDRFLRQQRIVGKRTSLWYRLRFRAAHNRPLTAAILALGLSLLVLSGYGVRTRIHSLREQQRAAQQAALAQKLGQSVERLEWLVRASYTQPLHNIEPEQAALREQMKTLDHDLQSYGEIGQALGHYALGRGHLALHDWDTAYDHLKQAEAAGVHEPELFFALGRALGERFNVALSNARRSGDKSFVEARRRELDRELLIPARDYLSQSRGKTTQPASFVEALLDRYSDRPDAALLNAGFALRQVPWLYEAAKLQGDVLLSRALETRDRGDIATARRLFQQAVARFESAAEQGRSDPQVYEELAEAWIRQEEMEVYQGEDPSPAFHRAVSASQSALESAPTRSKGSVKRAYAHLFVSFFHGYRNDEYWEGSIEQMINAAKISAYEHPEDPYVYDVLGNAYRMLADYLIDHGGDYRVVLEKSQEIFNVGISKYSQFVWAYNDLAGTYLSYAARVMQDFADPSDLLQQGLRNADKSLAIDPEFVNGHLTRITVLQTRMSWLVETGVNVDNTNKDIENYLSSKSGTKTNSLNAGLRSFVIRVFLRSKLEQLTDVSDHIQQALECSSRAESLDSGNWRTWDTRMTVLYLASIYALRTNASPESFLQQGLAAAGRCRGLYAGAECLADEGLLRALSAEWLQRTGRSPLRELDLAVSLAQKAAEKLPADMDVRSAVAQTWVRVAQVKLQRKLPVQADVDRGLALVGRLLAKAPKWPRALAAQGLLLRVRAKSTRGAVAQQAAQQAAAAMRLMGQGNPLLLKFYASEIADIDRLAGPAVTGLTSL